MPPVIGCCGIVCGQCPAYEATRDNNEQQRTATAKSWSGAFKTNLKPSDIECCGCACRTTAKHFMYWEKCDIRRCCSGRELKNCAHCKEYPCVKLRAFFAWCDFAKPALEEIRKELQRRCEPLLTAEHWNPSKPPT